MKKLWKYAMLPAILLMAAVTGHAQERLQMKLGYSVSMPLGSLKNAVSNTSFRGFTGEITYPLSEQFRIGLGASYNDFYQKYPRQLYQTNDGVISAVLSNSIQTIPVVVKANYTLVNKGLVQPYIGAGAGFSFINYDQFLGEFPVSKTAFKPALTGDAGVNIPLGQQKKVGINLGANFNYLPFKYGDVKNLNNWGIHAGVFFPLR